MSALLALLLAATWTDPSGRVECAAPPDAQPTSAPDRYTSGEERIVLLPFIPRAEAPSAGDVMRRLSCGTALRAAPGALQATADDVSVSVSLVEAADGWAGAAAVGRASDARLARRAQQASAGCRILPPKPSVVADGRIYDASHRFSLPVPAGASAFESQSNGAARGAGWQVFLVPAAPGVTDAEAFARELATRSGAASTFVTRSQAGRLTAVLASGNFQQGGRAFFVQTAAFSAGATLVGAVLVADSASQLPAQQAFFGMLSSASWEGTR